MIRPDTIAMTPYPDCAGAASSLIGLVQQISAAIVGAVVGLVLGRSAWPLAGAVAIMGCLSLAIWALSRRARAEAHFPSLSKMSGAGLPPV